MSTTVNPYAIAFSTNNLISSYISVTASSSSSSNSTSNTNSSSSSSGSYSQNLVSQMSGLDANSLVNEMMASDNLQLNNLLAKEQTTQWTQDRYRSVTTNLQTFNSNYFDVLSSNYMLSPNGYSVYTATSSNTSAVTASASNTAKAGTYTINSATLATAAKMTGTTDFSNGGTVTNSSTVSSLGLSGTVSFTVNGVTAPVTYDFDANKDQTISQFMSSLSSQSGATFSYSELTGKFSVASTGVGSSQSLSIAIDSSAASTTQSNTQTVLNELFGNSQSFTGTASTPAQASGTSFTNAASDLVSNVGVTGTLNFNVNGKNVTYNTNGKTISQFVSDLSSMSGVNFSYSDPTSPTNGTGKFTIATTGIGTNQNLTIGSGDSNTQVAFDKIFGTSLITYTSATAKGNDGSFNITEPDGSSNTITKSSNTFSVDGVNYNFTNNITSATTIGVGMDTSSVVTKIQNFVNDYNNLIGGIQDAVNEKKDYNYKPLTTTQESSMTDSQITEWNAKAQQGLLGNDPTLSNMLTSMREAFYNSINDPSDPTGTKKLSITMADVGLSTSDDYTQGGKLTLDVNKLTSALQNNPQQVISLFTQASSSYSSYTTALNDTNPSQALSTRSNEEGIFQRLSDIVQEYAGTYRDNNGNQGILLMKAGMSNTTSDTNNSLYRMLQQEKTAVTDFQTKMNDDKTRYTTMFNSLQSALSQLSTQQSYISSMLSSSSSS